jgi:hypothetical protein
VSLEDTWLGSADVTPAEKVPSQDGDPVSSRSGNALDLRDESGGGHQSPGKGIVYRPRQFARQDGARQVDKGPQGVGDEKGVSADRLCQIDVP